MNKILPLAGVCAVIGGGVGAGVVTAVNGGDGGTTTTVVRQAPLAQSTSSGVNVSAKDGGLTARDIYKRDAPGVVFIKAQIVQRSSSPFDFGGSQRGTATGSGFVIDKSGDILTNAHVVEGASSVSVQFADKKSVKGEVVGRDVSTDLAVIKVDPSRVTLRPLELGSAKDIQVGDPVVAIGNPFGLDRTLTTGVVSALQREIPAPNHFAISHVIQTDAPINPGNSGGPLIDATGKVVGINSQIETGGSGNGNVGIGFAVPIDTAKQVVPQLKNGGTVERGYLGVSTYSVDASLSELNLPVKTGALVQSVDHGSPAEKAGLRAGNLQATVDGNPVVIGGDIVTKVDGKPVTSNDGLRNAVAGKKPGDEVELTFQRGKQTKTAKVKLAARPSSLDQVTTGQQTP